MEALFILLIIVAVAVLGKANAVAVAAAGLLILKLLQVDRFIFPMIEKYGLYWGLVLLIGVVLMPLAVGKITLYEVGRMFISPIGIIAFVLSFVTTYLSGQGLDYLTVSGHAEIMPALILGAVAAAALLGGVPVGPFITCGLLVVMLKLFSKSSG